MGYVCYYVLLVAIDSNFDDSHHNAVTKCVFLHESLHKDDEQDITWSAGKATHTMDYAFISAATRHFQVTGAPFFNVVVGSVTVLVSIAKRSDWEVITTMSDRVASDSAMPLVSG